MEKNFLKCLFIGGMSFAFFIVSLFINLVVSERSELSEQTQQEISQSWSNQQNFLGPTICVPVVKDTVNSTMPYTCMYILPDRYEIAADVESEILHRGIFDASVYRTKVNGTGTFNLKDMMMSGMMKGSNSPVRFDWQHAQIIASISDKRGLEEGMKVSIQDITCELNSRFYNYGNEKLRPVSDFGQEPVCCMLDLSPLVGKDTVSFTINSEIKGSSSLYIAPIGQNSVITLGGNCTDPSFEGMMLPSSRSVTPDGFTATWKVSSLNLKDVEQVFYSHAGISEFEYVGAKLLVKGGQYTQTDRALKYAFLVILLSLAAVYVAEMCVKCEISALNYLLIGAALVIFYLLLLSFGEWIGFAAAYAVSALLVLGMITMYLKAIVQNQRVALAVCLFMALVDVFIYVLLSIDSMALLIGTLGLFIILGVAMFFSLRLKKQK